MSNESMLFRNDSDETIPPYGVLRVTGAIALSSGQLMLTVDQPDATQRVWYEVNGVTAVVAGNKGTTRENPCYVLYNSGSGTPALGDIWGAKDGQWSLEKNVAGFDILASPLNGRVLCRQYRVSGGSDVIEFSLDGALTGATGNAKVLNSDGSLGSSFILTNTLKPDASYAWAGADGAVGGCTLEGGVFKILWLEC